MGGHCGWYPGPNEDFPDWYAPKYRCCCGGCHVEKAVFWLTVISLPFSILGLLGALLFNGQALVGNLIGIVTMGTLLYALKSRNPSFYLPTIILNTIGLVVMAIVFVYVFLMMAVSGTAYFYAITGAGASTGSGDQQQQQITAAERSGRKSSSEGAVMLIAIFGILGVLFALLMALAVWFYSLYWRAWRYMKAEVAWAEQQGFSGHSGTQMKRIDF